MRPLEEDWETQSKDKGDRSKHWSEREGSRRFMVEAKAFVVEIERRKGVRVH